MRKNLNNDQIVPAALRGESAMTKNGNMSTDAYRVGFTHYGAPYVGSLSRVWRDILNAAFSAGRISQVIYSYSTPIAWHDSQYGWIIPRETYSVTTSAKHQTHLWRLHGRHIVLPWDATPEDAQRVLDGRMVFETDRSGREAVRTAPGPNYVAGE